jgi:hypothetical protein
VPSLEKDMARQLRQWAGARFSTWGPEEGDAALYGASALFAGLTALFSTIALYRVWAQLAFGPYVAAAAVALVLGRLHAGGRARDAESLGVGSGGPAGSGRSGAGPSSSTATAPATGTVTAPPQRRRDGGWRVSRIVLFLFVLVGATLAPLALEVTWRSEGNASLHVQPEVVVIEQAGHRAARGQDPYHAEVKGHRVISAVKGEPTYESFFPYLPLMTVFGLPSSTHGPVRVTDARIFFSLVTLLVVTVALVLCRGPAGPKVRALQVLTVLPTAALPLATGGDDMPIVAFLLLALVLAQRRQPLSSGLVLGVVCAMKFTAWPLAALALFAARDREGKRQPLRMALGMLVVIGPVVVPFLLRNPQAFVQNVIQFPLGLSGVASPAASPMPGHLLVVAFPWLHRILPLTVAVIGGALLARYLVRRPPRTASDVSSLGGWVMLVAIMFAPATRIGYLLYPINFFVWSYVLRRAEETETWSRGATGGSSTPPERDLLAA